MANTSNITMWANEYYKITKEQSRDKDRKEELKNKMLGALEALGVKLLELPNGLTVRHDEYDAEEFDKNAFARDYPELYRQYLKMKPKAQFSIKGTPKR